MVTALGQVVAATDSGLVLAGGLGVIARVGSPYRATADMDGVVANLWRETSALLAIGTATGRADRLDVAGVPLDLIEVDPSVSWGEIATIAADNPDGFHFVAGHRFVWEEHTPIEITTGTASTVIECGSARALLAAKLGASLNPRRPSEKHASDALDVWKLLEACTTDRGNGYDLAVPLPEPVAASLVQMLRTIETEPTALLRRMRRLTDPPDQEAVREHCRQAIALLASAGASP